MILKTNLKFKGSRNYLHSTDIINIVTVKLSDIIEGYIEKLTLRKFSKKQMNIQLTLPPIKTEIFGKGKWHVNSNLIKEFWLTNEDELITQRNDCNEDKILKDSIIDDNEIIIKTKNDYNCIDNIVALTKKLSYELSPIKKNKWVFGQIDLNKKLPKHWKTISIKNNFIIESKFCKFDIKIDKSFYGKITFITSSL